MTDHAAVQDLQNLVHRQGWLDLLETVNAVLQSGSIPTKVSSNFPYTSPAESERLYRAQDTTRQLFQELRISSTSDSRYMATTVIDNGLCDRLGQVIGLMESFREPAKNAAPYRHRDSGAFMSNTE